MNYLLLSFLGRILILAVISAVLSLVQCTNHENYLITARFMSVKIPLLHNTCKNNEIKNLWHPWLSFFLWPTCFALHHSYYEVINFHFISSSLSIDLTIGSILHLGWACNSSLCAGHEQFQPMDTPSTQWVFIFGWREELGEEIC